MAITDLTNTKWIFNDVLDCEGQNVTYTLNFQSNNEDFTLLRLYNDSDYPNEMHYLSTTIKFVYENGWSLPLYKTITITGGTSATNSDFITWLQKNAVQDTGAFGVWKFNKTLDIAEYYTSYDINFTTPYGDYQDQYNFLGFNLIGDYPAGRDRLGYLTDGAVGVTVYDTSYSLKWTQYYFRIVNITSGDNLYNSELQTLLNSNAKKITPIELTNTAWIFDENDLIFPMNSTTININFTSNSSNFTKITFSNNSTISYYSPKLGGNMTVYTASNGFTPAYKHIEITDGADVSTESAEILIAANAAQIITYITTDTELSSIADAIREKGNTTEQLVYPAGFVSAIQNIQGGDIYEPIYKSLAYRSVIASSASGVSEWCNSLSSTTFQQFAGQPFSGNFVFNNVSSIGSYTFGSVYINTTGATSYWNCSFPGCTTIGNGIFYYNRGIKEVYFPQCSYVGSYEFCGCGNLTSISFPICTIINDHAFYVCTSLSNINFPNCTSIGNQAFYVCTSLSNINFPNCTSIGNQAFYLCSALTVVSFPNCTSIGNYAFRYCKNLSSFYFMGSSIPYIGTYTFNDTTLTFSSYLDYYGSIYVPTSLLASYKTAQYWSQYSARMVGV